MQPATTPRRPTASLPIAGVPIQFKPALRLILAAAGWTVLIAVALLTACLAGWILLGALLLRGGQLPVIAALVVLMAATAGIAWLVARFVASARAVTIAIGALAAILLLIGVTWALASPDQALYLAREMAWDGATVWDYQKYPQRPIHNAPTAFHFAQNASPQLFQSVAYPSGSQVVPAGFDQFLAANHTTSFIVIQDGAILYEKYFNGYGRNSIVPSFSMAKSLISALVGIAVEERAIASLDDPMVAYLPELRGRGLDTVTIRHLVSMSSGIRCTRSDDMPSLLSKWPFNDKQMAYSYPNLRSLALSATPTGIPPGAQFDYCDYNPLLLGLILERTTHQSLARYLEEKIWQPVGTEYPGSWDLDSQASGFEKAEVGINGRAIDFAKFGQLYLNHGAWNGRQIIPAAWVVESTAPIPNDPRAYSPAGAAAWKAENGYAKYLWWGRIRADGSYDYMAWGAQGEFIFISPKARAVVVRFGIDEGAVDSWANVFEEVIAKLK